jgi:hypothetical protein
VARFKYRPPIVADGAPAIYLTEDAVKLANEVAYEMPERIKRGMELFLLGAAKILREGVVARSPNIDGVGYYAENLEVVLVEGMGNEVGIALLYKNKPRKLNVETEGRRTALLFKPYERSPKWVRALAKYQPWPSYMVPTMPMKSDAQVIARTITEKEDQDLHDRIMANRQRIEFDLKEAGLRENKIRTSTKPSDSVDVIDDIGYAVLRAEFGYGGPVLPHWRPALAEMAAAYGDLQRAFVEYVQTGKDNGFDLPNYKKVAENELDRYDDKVQDKLAPYAKGG